MIDLRSDTVTKPSPRMYEAMATAEVGDDVYGDDPTINELEETVADMLGFEAGMYVTSGTQSNFAAVLTHCGRGEEYIIGEAYHVYRAEAVGTAALGGIIPQTVPVLDDGSVDLYFGPKAPQGKEDNWLQTVPGKGWFLVLRLYSPTEAWFDKTWRPGEIELVD